MGKARGDVWQQATRKILDSLDLRAEFTRLGVEITGSDPNDNGWVQCRVFGEQDANPSAGVNVGDTHPQRGRYHEFSHTGRDHSFFEFAAIALGLPTWKEARVKYAADCGIQLPESAPKKHPDDVLEFLDYNIHLANSWCGKKSGIDERTVCYSGARLAHYSRKTKEFTVLAFPAYGEQLLEDSPVGYLLYNITGRPLLQYLKGQPPHEKKMLLAGGSQKGWVGRWGLSVLPKAELVWKVEGGTDVLAVQSACSKTEFLHKHAILSNSSGTLERPERRLTQALIGKRVMILHDADQPGDAGAKLWAMEAAKVADEVRIVRLPYPVTENHGKDVRDFLNEGHTYLDLLALIDTAEIVKASDKPMANRAGDTQVAAPWESDAIPVDDDDMVLPPPAANPSAASPSPATPPATPSASASPVIEGTAKPDGMDPREFIYRKILSDLQIDVLGELEGGGGKIKVFSEFHRKTDIIPDVNKLTAVRLLQICGFVADELVTEKDDGSGDGSEYHIGQVRRAISWASGLKRIGENSEVGLGCWDGRAENGDPDDSVLLVNAGEASCWTGLAGLVRIRKSRAGGNLLDLSGSTPWYDHDVLSGHLSRCDQTWSAAVIEEANELFGRWIWKVQEQSPIVVTGLLMATWVQTLWAWRPQVSVSGASNSGKSSLFECLGNLMGGLAIRSSSSSAAGVRQAIQRSARGVFCDEFEDSRHRADILEMIKASSRGDATLRGTSAHKGQAFELRHIVWTAGIETGLKREADRNRFISLQLLPPPQHQAGNLIVPKPADLNHLGQRLLAIAIKHVGAAKSLAVRLKSLRFGDAHRRVVESLAAPCAILACALGYTDEQATDLMTEMLKVAQSESIHIAGDESALLGAILESMIDLGGGNRLALSQCLKLTPMDGNDFIEFPKHIEKFGVGVFQNMDERLKDQGVVRGDFIFIAHNTVIRHLLRGTTWERQNINEILERIPGAVPARKVIGGARPRGVLIPRAYIDENM